jgi:hypothetical protein
MVAKRIKREAKYNRELEIETPYLYMCEEP